jgi:chlorobactene glucosyltransferase
MPYFIASTVLFIIGLIVIHWIHGLYHLDVIVTPAPPPSNPPLISVCIPARDEAANIRNCVNSLLEQDYPHFEIIAVDDRSSDSTLAQLKEIAAHDTRLKAISGSDLPAGWAGKPHALYQASAVARGEWLCFVDADTLLAPQALSSCYAKAVETRADLFTTLHRQVLATFWEKTVMPLIMTALSVGFPPRKVNDPARRDAVANGQFMLMRRSVYDSIGGHARVKDHIVEDKAIAEQVKWNGYRLVIADGRQFIRTRMYTSLAFMWEGWTKNIYLGLREHTGMLLLGAFGAILGLIAALFLPIWPILGGIWYFNEGGWPALGVIVQALLVWGALLHARADVARRMDIPAWYAWTTPLGAGIFAGMMLASAWKVISGQGVTWRGRKYLSSKRGNQ